MLASLKILRPLQWIKSVYVLTGMVFSNDFSQVWAVTKAVMAFSLISSAVYIYNDMHDLEEDQNHPVKRFRPLAAEKLSLPQAWMLFFMAFGLAFFIAAKVSHSLVYILISYCGINVFYNYRGKTIPWVDVSCIAAGFLLRIMAGTLGVGLPLSFWLALAATMLSFFIALSKRFLEQKTTILTSRQVLFKYNPQWLKIWIMITLTGCILSYSRYIIRVHFDNLPFLLSIFPVTLVLIKFGSDVLGQRYLVDDPLLLIAYDTFIQLMLAGFTALIILALLW